MAGRPTKYDSKYNKIVYRLCLLGATDKEIAEILEIPESTLNNWKLKFPEFMESIKRGKEIADSKVALSLFQRATGYEHKDLYITQYQGSIVSEEIIKHYPPDTAAMCFWLKNRKPNLWRERFDHTSAGEKISPMNVFVAEKSTTEKLQKLINEPMPN